jgi:hypothetical protein
MPYREENIYGLGATPIIIRISTDDMNVKSVGYKKR